jgi:hypothetical protein
VGWAGEDQENNNLSQLGINPNCLVYKPVTLLNVHVLVHEVHTANVDVSTFNATCYRWVKYFLGTNMDQEKP